MMVGTIFDSIVGVIMVAFALSLLLAVIFKGWK